MITCLLEDNITQLQEGLWKVKYDTFDLTCDVNGGAEVKEVDLG